MNRNAIIRKYGIIEDSKAGELGTSASLKLNKDIDFSLEELCYLCEPIEHFTTVRTIILYTVSSLLPKFGIKSVLDTVKTSRQLYYASIYRLEARVNLDIEDIISALRRNNKKFDEFYMFCASSIKEDRTSYKHASNETVQAYAAQLVGIFDLEDAVFEELFKLNEHASFNETLKSSLQKIIIHLA